MAPIWKPIDLKILTDWYSAVIDEASDQLTDWEVNFMEGIGKRLLNQQQLSEAQERTLEKIYAKYTK